MVKIYLSSMQQVVSTKLHIEEQFQVEIDKKQNEKYIMQYFEELEYLLSVYCQSTTKTN